MDNLIMIKSLKDTRSLIDALIANKEDNFALQIIPKPIDQLVAAANACINALQNGNKIFFMGNGGSAAEAQHLAGELVSYFMRQSEPYAAIALNTDTSVITAIANDLGYEHVFSRQLQALSKPGDVAIYLSTSGISKNILKAMEYGKKNGVVNISFTGMKTRYMQPLSDYYIAVPSTSTPHIQEAHLILGHLLCQYIEEKLQHKVNDDF
jgi:D-sedoheptulose 7-phosphate isomerase